MTTIFHERCELHHIVIEVDVVDLRVFAVRVMAHVERNAAKLRDEYVIKHFSDRVKEIIYDKILHL